jgi:hypothetical protein
MQNLNATISYSAANATPIRNRAYKNKTVSRGAVKKVSFHGWNPATVKTILDKAAAMGANPIIAPLVSTIGILAVRPAITMADKETPMNDRVYSAAWQTGIALGGLSVMLPFGPKIEALSQRIAEKAVGGLSQADGKLVSGGSHLVEAVIYNNKRTIQNILNTADDKVDDLVKHFESKAVKKSFTESLKGLNPVNLFKSKEAVKYTNPIVKNPGLIHELRENRAVAEELLNRSKKDLQKVLTAAGFKKGLNFILLMGALAGASFLVTRYLNPVMNFVGEKLNIKALQKKEEKTEKTDDQQKNKTGKWNAFDKTVFTALGGLALVEGINLVGNLFRKNSNVAYKAIKNTFGAVNSKLKITENLGKLTGGLKNRFAIGQKFEKTLAKQANNSSWLERSIWFNLITRLGINLPTGQFYNATRDAVDQTLQLSFLKLADNTIVKPSRKAFAKFLSKQTGQNISEYNRGVNVITEQVVKNFLIVCTMMGFMNNAVSGRIIKSLGIGDKGKKPEKDYQDYKKNFIYAENLKDLNLQSEKQNGTIKTMQEFLQLSKNAGKSTFMTNTAVDTASAN